MGDTPLPTGSMDVDDLPWDGAKRLPADVAERHANRGWVLAKIVCAECGRMLGFVTRDREFGNHEVEVHFPAPLTAEGIAYLGRMALVDDDFRPRLAAKADQRFERWVERRTLALDRSWQEPLDPATLVPARCERHGFCAVSLADVRSAISTQTPGGRPRRLAASLVQPGG